MSGIMNGSSRSSRSRSSPTRTIRPWANWGYNECMAHTPVLLDEVLQFLNPQPNGRFIDSTLGAGGHTQAILEKTVPSGSVLALDQDEMAIAAARQKLESFGSRLVIVKANF